MQSLMLDELKISSVDDDQERVVIVLKIDDPVRFDDSTVPNEVSSAQLVVDLMDRRVLVQIKKEMIVSDRELIWEEESSFIKS